MCISSCRCRTASAGAASTSRTSCTRGAGFRAGGGAHAGRARRAWRARGWRNGGGDSGAAAAVAYATNFVMSADHIFRQPRIGRSWQPPRRQRGRAVASRRRRRHQRRSARLSRAVHRLSPSGARHRRRHARARELLHGVPHGTRVRPSSTASSRRSGSSAWITSTRCSRIGRPAAGGVRRPARRSPDRERESACGDSERQVTLAQWLSLHPHESHHAARLRRYATSTRELRLRDGRESPDADRHRHDFLERQGVGRRRERRMAKARRTTGISFAASAC